MSMLWQEVQRYCKQDRLPGEVSLTGRLSCILADCLLQEDKNIFGLLNPIGPGRLLSLFLLRIIIVILFKIWSSLFSHGLQRAHAQQFQQKVLR